MAEDTNVTTQVPLKVGDHLVLDRNEYEVKALTSRDDGTDIHLVMVAMEGDRTEGAGVTFPLHEIVIS